MSRRVTDEAVEITDPSGTAARIVTGYGFNCASFSVATAGGPIDVIWSEPDFGPASAPDLNGIPVLFPFGGRMNGTTFRWRGVEYTITGGRMAGDAAIHGFVLDRPWRVIEQSGNRVVGEFHASVDEPSLLDQWPSDFRIRMAYEVGPSSLTCDVTVDNPDTKPMPYGFATHGYFRTPLADGDGEACEVTVPAAATWVLDENAIPTGEIRPVDAENDLLDSPPIAGRQFNTVYTDLETDDNGAVICAVYDPAADRSIRIVSTGGFREVVVWNPPHRDAIAIEPYTCVVTTFDVEERGHDSGLRVLEPGQSDELRMVFGLASDAASTNLTQPALKVGRGPGVFIPQSA
jgi:aldose 1-epimerase